MRIPFTKMHGLGNDFIVVRAEGLETPEEPLIRRLADRHTQVAVGLWGVWRPAIGVATRSRYARGTDSAGWLGGVGDGHPRFPSGARAVYH